MNASAARPAHPDDAELVAWLDGELERGAAARVRAAVRAHASVRARVDLLCAARAEFAWALDRPHDEPPRAARGVRARWPSAATLLLAAAAVAIVLVIAGQPRRARDEAAENAWLALRLVPVQTGWDLFSCIRFELEGTAKTEAPCCVFARKPGETDEQFVVRAHAPQKGAAHIALEIEAEVTGPDGIARRGPVAHPAFRWNATSRLTVELADVKLSHPGISPRVDAALEPAGPREDFWWGVQHAGTQDSGGVHGFVPEQPGEYRIRFTLRAIAPPANVFPEPLSVATGFAVRGAVGAWSEPVDGMRARIVASRARLDAGQQLVFAVQLRNESDRARTFNVTGSTIAPIPQPYHFDLVVDDEPWQQRADLGTVTAASELALPLQPGCERTVVVLGSYWERDGAKFPSLRGVHRLAARFHFEASVSLATDKEIWQGRIDTPSIAVEIAAGK